MRYKTPNWQRFIEESNRAALIVHDAQFAQYFKLRWYKTVTYKVTLALRIGKKEEIYLLPTFPFKVHVKAGPKWHLMYIVARKLNIIWREIWFCKLLCSWGDCATAAKHISQSNWSWRWIVHLLFDCTCILSNHVVSLLKKLAGLINSIRGEWMVESMACYTNWLM